MSNKTDLQALNQSYAALVELLQGKAVGTAYKLETGSVSGATTATHTVTADGNITAAIVWGDYDPIQAIGAVINDGDYQFLYSGNAPSAMSQQFGTKVTRNGNSIEIAVKSYDSIATFNYMIFYI